MVFDATTKAFNPSESIDLGSPHASTSAAVAPVLPSTTSRPTKRRRITQSGTMSSTPASSPAPAPIIDLDALDAARRRAAGRVMSLWESLAEKYARPIEEDDEIDILTGKICRDRGVLRSVSERGWKIGSFGEALEVEPLVLVSEGETETGASEADDEGEGEDDTEGEAAEDTEEGGEDPLGSWSYDWQYRALPPPRPELSPQDAEDLKEFLAAENAIQENRRKNGKESEPEDEDEDDEIVYLGDSWHNTDGTLRIDESSDDEFASMAMTDSSTIRYMKHEGDDDEDDVEPMASILGALALGGTPRKQPARPSSPPHPKDAEMDNQSSQLSAPPQDSATGQDYSNVGPPIRPSTGASSANSIPGLGVDDDLIVIDSDSDDEPEPVNNSRMKPEVSSDSPSKPVVLPGGVSSSSSQTRRVSSDVPETSSTIVSGIRPHNLVAQIPKVSITNAATSLKPSASQRPASNTKCIPSSVPGSPIKTPTTRKSASKRVLGESVPRILGPFSSLKAASTPTKKKPIQMSEEANFCMKSPNKTETPTKAAKAAKRQVTTPGAGAKEKSSSGQDMKTCRSPPSKVDVPSPKILVSAATASPTSSSQPKSPTKRRKKATVVEVVLPIPRKAPKVKRESTIPSSPTKSKDTSLATTSTSLNQRSSQEPNESASSSELPGSTTEATHPAPSASLVAKSGVEPRVKRKRLSDGPELTENTGNALDPRTNVGSVEPRPGPLHVCCPPVQSGASQSVACCPTYSQSHQGSHSHAHTSHSAHTSCPAHHHLGMPVYQHQHQHQHLHTHLPYPLPQLPYTANELTEAAFKLIHGLSTFHQVSRPSGSPATGFWLPGAQFPFGFAIPSQAGPSSQTLAPKLEEPSSQEATSNECVPSSQEHERKLEAANNTVDEKLNQKLPALSQPEDSAPLALDSPFKMYMGATISTETSSSPSNPKLPSYEREMSVIDIESDSDDELAACDAGAGSMRWEPPVKKEVDTVLEEGFKRQPSPRKSPTNGRASRRTSPVKLKRMP